ncbi:MAG: lysophospholipid acyltransferase family protein [Oscillospiraceae bacterium]
MDFKKIAYKIARFGASITLGIVMPYKALGRENIPDGPALICANHSSWMDPIYLAFAVPGKYHMCIMAKEELFKKKFNAAFFNAIGTFPVNRSIADMSAMKTSLQYLRRGKKLAIFPEGTRSEEDGAVSPKSGAVRLAEKVGAPMIPVYIPRKKKFFKRTRIVIGKPFTVERTKERRTKEDYEMLADELMNRITALGKIDPGKVRA